MKSPAVEVDLPAHPFRGIESFRYVDRPVFFARDRDTIELAQYVSVYRGVLLYGDSGAGKSSLVNAGLIPTMLDAGFEPVRYRLQPQAGEELIVEPIKGPATTKVASMLSRGLAQPSLIRETESIEGIAERLLQASGERRPLLVFDQFEELVTLFEEAPPGDRKEARRLQEQIVSELTGVLNNYSLPVKLLFVFREDYLGKILKLFELTPSLTDQYLRLTPPPPDALREIVRGPFERHPGRYPNEISPELAKEVCSAIAERSEDDEISLSEVQIVCLRLWEAKDPEGLFRKKGVRGLLGDHMADALSQLDEAEQYAAVALLSRMITASGARNVITEEDLLTAVSTEEGISKRKLKDALEALEQKAKVIRRERRHKTHFYEIVSEFLVPWIVAQKQQRLARRQIDELVEQITGQEVDFHRRVFESFRLTRRATAIALGVTFACALAVVLVLLLGKELKLLPVAIFVTLPLAAWAVVQMLVLQRRAKYRDAGVRIAEQRQELLKLTKDSGGLTGGQVGRVGERLDRYAEDPVSWS